MHEQSALMDATAVASIGAATSLLTQIVKRSLPGDFDAYGPLIAALISLGGVALWVYSAPVFPPERTDLWAIGAGWVAVFATAVGIYQSVRMVTAPGEVAPARSTAARPVPPHEHQADTI